ncbi:MAG: hypothetical protein JJD92_08060 [Frankiaceae bacterium]|nr:hypothetical protein [Frankiaceae bacterium]
MAAAEIAMRQEDRDRSGLVNLGPGSVELASAMDASAGRALTTSRSRAKVVANGFARPTPIDRMLGRPSRVARVSAPEPGFNAMVVWATLITTLGDVAKGGTPNGTIEDKPESMTIGGNTGTITTTVTFRASASGGRLVVDMTMKSKGQVVDKATGAILYGIDSIASGHVKVDFCPDASGHAAVDVKLTSSEIYTQAGGSAKGVSKEFSGTATISVNDDAKISTVEGSAQASEDAKGSVPAPGGESTVTASTRTAGDNIANDGSGQRLPGTARDITLGGTGSTTEQQGKLWGSMTVFVETMVTAAATEAEKLWREGGCIEVIVDPAGGDVSPNEVTKVTAKLKHKIEGNELDKPVAATLTGVKTLEPAGEKQPAPATVTYTAGPNQGDAGRIHFTSVSNRGIGEKDVTFTVGSEKLKVSLVGKMTTSLGGLSFSTTLSAPSVVLTRQGDGTYAGSGAVKVGIDIGLCPPFSEVGRLKLVATREAGKDPTSPGRWTVAYDPTGQVAFAGKCVFDVEVPLDSFTGPDGPTAGFMFVLGDVVFDAEGGTRQIKTTKAVGPAKNAIDATMKAAVVQGPTQ